MGTLTIVLTALKASYTTILPYLIKYWKYVVGVLAALAVVLYWWHLTSTITSLNATITKQKTDIVAITRDRDTWKGNYDNLRTAVAGQNEQLQKLSSAAQTTKDNMDKLQGTVAGQVGTINTKLTQIANRDMVNMTCDQAIADLKQQALSRKK